MAGMVVGAAAGVLAGAKPLYLVVALVAAIVLVYFFADFERAVVGLLVLRSSLDILSAQQIPSLFAIAIDILTLLYVSVLLLTGRTVRTDWFWWFFAAWVMLQGIWPVLCVLGGLGLDTSTLPDNIREWTRLLSWLMVYLLVMQLQDRIPPEKMISLLFISLIPPALLALLQQYLPSLLSGPLAAGERIKGTFAHPNNFVLYLLLFIALSWWQLLWTKQRWRWLLLLGLLTNLYVGTRAIFSLAMLGTFLLVSILPKLKLSNMIGGAILLAIALALFASTDLGRDRLDMLANTPLFNPNMDVSRAILSSQSDYNSFNWRLAHWNYLLQGWQKAPIFGYGLATSIYLSPRALVVAPHNDYIRALVEGGIVGLATFLALLGAQVVRLVQLLWHAPPNNPQRDLCLFLLAVLIATAVGMCTDNVWYGTAFYFYWWTVLAVAGWNWQQPMQPVNSSTSARPMLRPLKRAT
jgi:O-antigen ligase